MRSCVRIRAMHSPRACSERRSPASGNLDRARQAFEASLRANPLSPGTYTNLAMLEMQAGHPRDAARRYAEALLLDPASETARRGLAEAALR